MKINQDILQIIEAGRSEGNLYYLPPEQLDRKVYEAVNKVLVALGGKWKGGKVKAHVFESPIDDAIQNVITTGEVTNRKQELNFFETPDKVADKLCEMAELNGKDWRHVLEPSAGKGAIIRALRRTGLKLIINYCEIDEDKFFTLTDGDYGQSGDFLSVDPDSDHFDEIDRIVMNPPFSINGSGRQTDIDHVTHALKFLVEDGILVSVMSPAIKFRTNSKTNDFRNLLDNHSWEIIDLPDGAFKESGTMIKTVILKVKL